MKQAHLFTGTPGKVFCLFGILIFITTFSSTATARDTDIYNVNTKQNAYVLIDNSGSMGYGVYEYNIDYGAMYDYLITLNDSNPPSDDYIWDTVNKWAAFYQDHLEMRKIFLWPGKMNVTVTTVDGKTVAFTGDAADPDYVWYSDQIVDTNTLIDSAGNLVYDGSGTQRLTVDAEGHILFDGARLPLNQDIKLHDLQQLYDGSVIDNGFGGLLNAPGYLFSGYEDVTAGALDVADNGDDYIYFFITGNWANMQAMYNLHYTENPDPPKASIDDPAWKYELFPISADAWSPIEYSAKYPGPGMNPSSGTYLNGTNYDDAGTVNIIVHPGAAQIQVHFSAMDVESKTATTCWDYVGLFDGNDSLVSAYCSNTLPSDGWSTSIIGDTVKVKFDSNNSVVGTGYVIDKIRVTYHLDSYLMQNRLDVAKDAMLYVIDEFHGKMNWGFATFHYQGTSADGATLHSLLNPNLTDDQNRAAIKNHVENVKPMYGTPLGEALQDVYEKGFYTLRHSLDNLPCRKNYIISITDGFPSDDEDWNRIGGVTFTDADGDGWTEDPYQNPTPAPNYYDDVAHWLYTHSWQDDNKTVVTNPEDSYENVITHHIAFGARHPLLQDAAGESGGEYITAYNKTQLVAAFYALALEMTEAVSFTAPVVSVDSQNKIQNGDDLYMGVFLPQGSNGWAGNLKKYRLGDGSAARPDTWMIYDGGNNEAITNEGEFKDNLTAIWADDNDTNDSDNYGAADVKEDGVGEVLTERVAANLIAGATTSSQYWERPIYTYLSGSITKFNQTNISSADLTVANDATKNALVNYVHGYTNEADTTTGVPLFARDWALGAIIHSRPVVVDYYDTNDISILLKRYIVIGANDGMLHVFDDADGQEIFAFIPTEILPNLKLLPVNPLVDTVDGNITLYRRNKEPKYLIFGERRGGEYYWALDISNSNPLLWDVAWRYTNPEIKQSWSEVSVSTIPISIDSDGVPTFKDVAIFTAGYDPEEDNYPEPFLDIDNNGTPYGPGNSIDNAEWKISDASQDINNNNLYDKYNPDKNEYGRGIYIVDIDDPTAAVAGILPFSISYGAADLTTGNTQTLTDMKYSFPASPSVATFTEKYLYRQTIAGVVQPGITLQTDVLKTIYATDIYANLYRVDFNFDIEIDQTSATIDGWTWSSTHGWNVTKVFSGNPGSDNNSGTYAGNDDHNDPWRKAFYSPAISWGGSCRYFDKGNYIPLDSTTTFYGTNTIASLFFGTGDREHPTYTMIRNRMYGIYDDSTVEAEQDNNGAITSVTVSTAPYTEKDLLNLSCDELDNNTTINSGATKDELKEDFTDDATYTLATELKYENGINEDDAKGWYIILEDQGDSTACSHCSYSATIDDTTTTERDNHEGEKILSKPVLYANILYFTSYQPSVEDPCNPLGNGLAYSINYCDTTAAYDLNINNGKDRDVTDRYKKYTGILGIPSGFAVINRHGEAGAMSMMGAKVIGPKGSDDPTIDSPGLGLELYYWREGNSLKE
jgi:type IV pilus assembly protein PilY1